jgi:hypothetical protein
MLEGLPHWCTELETARCNLQSECRVGKTFQTVYREAVDGIIVSFIPNSLENSEYIPLLHNVAVHEGSWGVSVGEKTCDSVCICIKQVMHHGKECLGGFSNPVDKWRVFVLHYFQICWNNICKHSSSLNVHESNCKYTGCELQSYKYTGCELQSVSTEMRLAIMYIL